MWCGVVWCALQDLFVGATVSVYGRQLKLIGYGDEYTRAQLEDIKARSVLPLCPVPSARCPLQRLFG
jgi:hypothetical protein